MEGLTFYILDVFTEEKYAGNQLAVVADAGALSDEQMQKIAVDASVDPGIFAIFVNGYALHCKRVS